MIWKLPPQLALGAVGDVRLAKFKGSGLLDFIRALWSEWFTAMSGALSVPAALAALWLDNPTLRVVVAVTALVCFWAAAYRVWKKERDRNLETDDVSYGLDILGETEDQMLTGGDKLSCHVRVANKTSRTIEFGPASFIVTFGENDIKPIKGQGQILRTGQAVSWSVSSSERTIGNATGGVKVEAEVHYGLAGQKRARRLSKIMNIAFVMRDGIIFQSNSSSLLDSDTAVSDGDMAHV